MDMHETLRLQTGGRILVEALKLHGTDTVFCVPGESYLEVLDALYDQPSIRLVSCRHESGAAFMAEAAGKLTGRPGICFVTRGPGAANASIAVHTAQQDSTPMILFIGQVPREMQERGAFQEVDYRHMYAPLAKWVVQIDDAARIPELVARAFQTAVSGRPGPVVVALPEDMLTDSACAPPAQRYRPLETSPGAAAMQQLQALMATVQQPLLLLGGSGWTDAAWHDIAHFAERNGLPVACSFRRQDLFDHRHEHYIGEAGLGINPRLAQRIQEADLIIAVGARLGEVPSNGYSLLRIPLPQQRLVHVLPGAEELGRVYQPELAIHATPAAFAAAARELAPVDASVWADWRRAAREDFLQWQRHVPLLTPVDMGEVIALLRELLPRDAIVTNGAGNYSAWLHRHYAFSHPHCQLAPTSGAMGYGVPAAIAAKLLQPQRTVVCLAGDGCFLMTAQELATAVQYRAAAIFIIVNNRSYGTIRMHQERQYPGRVIGTDIRNPDFVAFARSFGAAAERVDRTAGFAGALKRALASQVPYCIELVTDPEFISPRASITSLRAQARAERGDAAPEG